MKILMIGLGSIGQRHLRNIRKLYGDSVEIIAYRVRGLKRTFSDDMKIRENVVLEDEFNIKTYSDLDEALKTKPDAAFITNITSLHVECAIKCAENGCNLFIEKPLSYNLDGVETLQKIVENKKIIAYMGFQNRFHPCVKYLKEIINNKEIGDILSVNMEVGERLTTMHTYENYAETYMARKDMGGGVVLNQQIHEIDYITDILGMPSSVFAMATKNNALNIDVEDNSSAIYDINGIPVYIHCDFMQYPPSRICKVIGTKGYITIDIIHNYLEIALDDKITKIEFKEFQRNDMFIEELEDFMKCIEKQQKPLASLESGIKTLKIALATLESAKTSQKLRI